MSNRMMTISAQVACAFFRSRSQVSGAKWSSPSTNRMYSPVACAIPQFRADTTPPFVLWMATIRESVRAYRSIIRDESSVLPSSTTMISISFRVWPIIESRHFPIYCSILYTGTMTDTLGCIFSEILYRIFFWSGGRFCISIFWADSSKYRFYRGSFSNSRNTDGFAG